MLDWSLIRNVRLKLLNFVGALILGGCAARAFADDVFIRVSLIGYRPSGFKLATAMGRDELPSKFQVVNSATNMPVFEGDASLMREAWGKFGHLARLNFASVKNEGNYFIQFGEAKSPTFSI